MHDKTITVYDEYERERHDALTLTAKITARTEARTERGARKDMREERYPSGRSRRTCSGCAGRRGWYSGLSLVGGRALFEFGRRAVWRRAGKTWGCGARYGYD